MNEIETQCCALRILADEIVAPDCVPAQCLREAADMLETVAKQRDEIKRQLDLVMKENLEMRRANQESDNWKDDELYCFRCDTVMSACGCPLNDDGNEEEPKKTVSHPPDPA